MSSTKDDANQGVRQPLFYRPEIDGLRAFAVVTVIINHVNEKILPGGYLGVDIFFVISGYVITSSLSSRSSKNLKDFLRGFYERRVKRIVPALSVFVLIMSIAICLFNPAPDVSLRTGITSLFGLSNLYLLKQSTDYFAQSTQLNVFTHTWSLGVEEQFYILFPFLIWCSGFGRQTRYGSRNLFLIVGVLATLSLVGFLFLYPIDPQAAYFLMPTRFWEMAAGCLIFIGFQKKASIEQCLEKVPPLFVIALIIGVMYLPISIATASTIAIIALSSILIASLKRQTAAFTLFTNPKVVYIGLISYSLYLWHWGVLSISSWTIGIHWWSIPFQVILMFGLAVASYRYIEKPIRNANRSSKRGNPLVIGGFALVANTVVILATLTNTTKAFLYTGTPMTKLTTAYRYRGREIDAESSPEFRSENCHDNFDQNKCHIAGNRKTTLYLMGDSHADQLRETGYLLHKNYKIGVFSVTTAYCNFPVNKTQFLATKECYDFPERSSTQNKASEYLHKNIKEGDLIILSNRFPLNRKSGAQFFWLENVDSVRAINRFFEKIESRGASLIIFLPVPEFNITSQLCVKQWFRPWTSHLCVESQARILEKQKMPRRLIREKLDKRIHVFDPLPHLCNPICMVKDTTGRYMYIDDNHITDHANKKYIYPNLASFLKTRRLI